MPGRFFSLALLSLVLCGAVARAEIFHLANGGQVEGELLNPDESPRTRYVIRTATGGQLTLESASVDRVESLNPREAEYAAIRHKYPDTIEGQWELSEWCRENFLNAEREFHLRRIVELDADNEQARRALGYSRINGAWKTQEEAMVDLGKVRYQGRWLYPQEVELIERSRKQELAEKAWFATVKRLREWLESGKQAEARQQLLEIRDPAAVPALKQYLGDEPNEDVRLLYVTALGNINTAAAVETLALRALEDPAREVRLTCLDHLEREPRPAVVQLYIQKLRDKDNNVVNLAAVGLARLEDPIAVAALIDALVTTHKFKITYGPPGSTSAGFSSDGSAGFSNGPKTKIISQELRNQAVLEALVMLAGGVNYSYDQAAWRSWYSAQKKQQFLDARRD